MNSLPKTVTRQRRSCDVNPGPSAPESSTLTTRLPSHPIYRYKSINDNTYSIVSQQICRVRLGDNYVLNAACLLQCDSLIDMYLL